jgi:ribosomal protein L11 methylase PrmA
MKHNYVRHSLERQIFFSLVGISFSSVILIAVFWANNKHQDYLKEVDRLKKTFSEDRKAEIKNHILNVKDYIDWTKSNPLKPMSMTLAAETDRLWLAQGSGEIVPGNQFTLQNKSFLDSQIHGSRSTS